MPIEFLGKAALADHAPALALPLYTEPVSAGFPSPAQDFIERTLDLNELCIEHPSATFFVRVEGHSMIEAGIYPRDVLVVDCSLQARSGDIVVARLFDEFTVKELELKPPPSRPRLLPRNASMQPIEVPDGTDLEIIGVVTFVLHNTRRQFQ